MNLTFLAIERKPESDGSILSKLPLGPGRGSLSFNESRRLSSWVRDEKSYLYEYLHVIP